MRARKAIYGFAEAARHFWMALSESMERAGWRRSLLEDAFFTLRKGEKLFAMAVTHVDDMLLARLRHLKRDDVLGKVATDFEWKWASGSFTFRGREIEDKDDAINVTMTSYAASLKGVVIEKGRRSDLTAPLDKAERKEWQRCTG